MAKSKAEYGSKGQKWHQGFLEYMEKIVKHAQYAGMPDAIKDDGKIQWEAPSNRKSGLYQHTHQKRREWWQKKALSIGISPTENEWISRTAKRIHPFGRKPCKRCGKVMRLAYVYPNANLLGRLRNKLPKNFQFVEFEEIEHLVARIFDEFPKNAALIMNELFGKNNPNAPKNGSKAKWLAWINKHLIPSESSMLSPGAMSNAPDRFDGFHSFNLCCRGKADTGRAGNNLRSYTTDRRVFEYWSEGNWIAADRLMGEIRSKFRTAKSADGGKGPPSADHIGPLSLGFMHRPEFRLLSASANSAKNNRMTLWDVRHLIEVEAKGEPIISWYARHLWDARKSDAVSEATALMLSKMMRDNQRYAMRMVSQIYEKGFLSFLASLLELEYADQSIEFINLRIENYVTKFDKLKIGKRETTYASEQKVRRLRIGFEALKNYAVKKNRHFFPIKEKEFKKALKNVCDHLGKCQNKSIKALDQRMAKVFSGDREIFSNADLLEIVEKIPSVEEKCFREAQQMLKEAMAFVGEELNNLWGQDRYLRERYDFDT